jgi:predicted acetyltransferase
MSGRLVPFTPELAEAVADAQSYAFAAPRADVPRWLARAGHENVHVWQVGERVAGAAIGIPMGLWLGGRSIRNLGVAGVAVGPEHRGQGYGRELMAALMRRARAEGYAVSTLYASTASLYRKVGFEHAGALFETRLPAAAIEVRAKGGELVRLSAADQPRLAPLAQAVAQHGNLDRGPYIWARLFAPGFRETQALGVTFDGALEGYVILRAEAIASPPDQELFITDITATTPRAARRLLSFLAEHRSLVRTVHLPAGPNDPLLGLLPEPKYVQELVEPWMLRVLDVQATLQGRGYRPMRKLSFGLEVEDAVCPDLAGRYAVTVEDGRATVERGGQGPALRLEVGALGSLCTGFRSASTLARMGVLEGDPAAVAAADQAFADPMPFMREMF